MRAEHRGCGFSSRRKRYRDGDTPAQTGNSSLKGNQIPRRNSPICDAKTQHAPAVQSHTALPLPASNCASKYGLHPRTRT
jgi:hypothetical protein